MTLLLREHGGIAGIGVHNVSFELDYSETKTAIGSKPFPYGRYTFYQVPVLIIKWIATIIKEQLNYNQWKM